MNNLDIFLNDVIVMDIETNSTKNPATGDIDIPTAEIIEMGFVIRDETQIGWIEFDELHGSSRPVHPEVSAVTHITTKMIAGKKMFNEVSADFNGILGKFSYIVAHNHAYDRTVLTTNHPEITNVDRPWICTYRLAKKLFSQDTSVSQFNLSYLRYRFELNVPDDLPSHRASADSFICARLLERLIQEMVSRGLIDDTKEYGPQIIDYLNAFTRIDVMPTGRHRGKPLSELPYDYIVWMINNMAQLNEKSHMYDHDFATSIIEVIETKYGDICEAN